MKYTEIIKLLDAGYTRDEILQMQDDPKPEDTKPEDTKPEDPKPEDPKPEDTKPEDPKADLMGEIKDMFAEMKKEFTAMNIMNSRREDQQADEDIIANIINPFKKEGK